MNSPEKQSQKVTTVTRVTTASPSPITVKLFFDSFLLALEQRHGRHGRHARTHSHCVGRRSASRLKFAPVNKSTRSLGSGGLRSLGLYWPQPKPVAHLRQNYCPIPWRACPDVPASVDVLRRWQPRSPFPRLPAPIACKSAMAVLRSLVVGRQLARSPAVVAPALAGWVQRRLPASPQPAFAGLKVLPHGRFASADGFHFPFAAYGLPGTRGVHFNQ